MGLGPDIIIRGFEQEDYLAPMSALITAGVMNTVRLFLTRMKCLRDIVSVDNVTFLVCEGRSSKGRATYIGASTTLRGPFGNTFLVTARDHEAKTGTSWEVEIANHLTESAKASIRLELTTAQRSAAMLEHAIEERFKLFPV